MLKDYLLDVMQQHEHGLYMCELPTGNGKTYDSARAMKEYTDSIGNDTKIIYLTTLNKNLPEDALRAAYGSEELYKRNVFRQIYRTLKGNKPCIWSGIKNEWRRTFPGYTRCNIYVFVCSWRNLFSRNTHGTSGCRITYCYGR